jgi:hypothetical protein
MPENNANACILLTTIATTGASEQGRERGRANQFLITKNAKYTIGRKNTRERELLSIKEEMNKHYEIEPYRGLK